MDHDLALIQGADIKTTETIPVAVEMFMPYVTGGIPLRTWWKRSFQMTQNGCGQPKTKKKKKSQ